MKKHITNLLYASLLLLALVFTACQEEFEDIGSENDNETIEVGSTTAELIVNTSSNDGSYDNIVDEASCFAIQFPYTVVVADIEIIIDSIADLRNIEEIFDEFDTDDDLLDIIFPITIIYDDFSELVIENKEQLRELASECIEGGRDDDIECIDFVYPITLFTFDVDNQQTGSVTVNNDREMRRFFKDRNPEELVSLDFPITLIKFDGTEIMVDNNAELAAALEQAKDECDEDDDNDYNDDDFDEERFVEYLTECPWKLLDIRRFGVDQMGQYEGFVFEFDEDGVVEVTGPLGNTTISGEWGYEFTPNGAVVELAFNEFPDFSATWLVYGIDENRIKFYSDNENRIIFKKRCEGDGEEECDIEEVADLLEECKWRIADASEDFYFEGVIDFSNRNIHAYSENGTAVDEGNWEVTDTGLRFNALFSELEGMTGDWEIVECGEYRIKLMNGDGRYYVLEKDCDFEVPNLDTLREILSECEWIIKKVKNQGEEIDRLLGYEFKFMAEGMVTLSNGVNTSEGTWEIGYNSEQILSLLISIGDEPGVSFEWPLRDLDDDRLKFEVEEIDYELVLLRVCDDNAGDGDVSEIRNIMMGGAWNVALYEDEATNATAEFEGYDFYFNENHQVQVDENDNPIIEGLWRVLRDNDNNLMFYLNFANDELFGELTDDWYITEVSTERIELVYEDDESGNKVLVFEKKL